MNFNWLHLSDLHCGMRGHKHLWPNVKSAFFEDLGNLHEKSGPWHAVFFTGDFVQKGKREEFSEVTELLGQLWERFRALGSDPVLLPVPGNHDLVRPDVKSAASLLLRRIITLCGIDRVIGLGRRVRDKAVSADARQTIVRRYAQQRCQLPLKYCR